MLRSASDAGRTYQPCSNIPSGTADEGPTRSCPGHPLESLTICHFICTPHSTLIYNTPNLARRAIVKRFVVILSTVVIVGCSTATDHAIRDRLAVFVDTPISFHGEVMQEYRRLDYIEMFVRPLTPCEITRKQDAKILASLEVVPYLRHEKRKLSPRRLREKFLEWWKNSGGEEHAHRLQRFETGGGLTVCANKPNSLR